MDKNRDISEDLTQQVEDELATDLKRLLGSPSPIPSAFDAQIMAHYRRAQTRWFHQPWVRYAAAAMILLTVALAVIQDRSASVPQGVVAAGPMDIDQDGSVNILDALRLAQQLPIAPDVEAQWDFNSDGKIDRRDVDLVAYRAVRLSAREVL